MGRSFEVYVLREPWRDGKIPRHPEVRIVLGEYWQMEGQAVLSVGLATDEEIDAATESLRRELEQTCKDAKAKLKELKAKSGA